MFGSHEDFLNYIDNLIPSDVDEELRKQLFQDKNQSWSELMNLQEQARNATIKQLISSTHCWTRAVCTDDMEHKTDIFWCDKCGIKASVFENIGCLSILRKVLDKLPTYTVHNQYLMYKCEEILAMTDGKKYCFECGIPEKCRTIGCEIIDVER